MGICCRLGSGNSNRDSVSTQRATHDGEEVGREVQKVGDICIPMAHSCWGLRENKLL